MKSDSAVYADIKAENLTVGTVIVEGLTGKLSFYQVTDFSQQGHEVHVSVRPLGRNDGKNPHLNWCYQAEARVFVQ